MKTVKALPASALSHKPRVKNSLLEVLFTSHRKNSIFATAIAALISYIGALFDDNNIIVFGGITFLVGVTAWSMREIARDIRQDKLGINNDKW